MEVDRCKDDEEWVKDIQGGKTQPMQVLRGPESRNVTESMRTKGTIDIANINN